MCRRRIYRRLYLRTIQKYQSIILLLKKKHILQTSSSIYYIYEQGILYNMW